jgi:hypothetical protein
MSSGGGRPVPGDRARPIVADCIALRVTRGPWQGSGVFDESEELGQGKVECRGHAIDDQGDVAGASLDIAQIGTVDANPFCEFFLR